MSDKATGRSFLEVAVAIEMQAAMVQAVLSLCSRNEALRAAVMDALRGQGVPAQAVERGEASTVKSAPGVGGGLEHGERRVSDGATGAGRG